MSTAMAVRSEQSPEHQFDYDADGTPALLRAEEFAHEGAQAEVREKFRELADELEEAAASLSSTRRALRLPAFIEILALGDRVIPEVVERLRTSESRPLWLRVLGTLTPFPPGAGKSTIDEAADEWVRWGRQRGGFTS